MNLERAISLLVQLVVLLVLVGLVIYIFDRIA